VTRYSWLAARACSFTAGRMPSRHCLAGLARPLPRQDWQMTRQGQAVVLSFIAQRYSALSFRILLI
jgi:hypothetical protein